MGMGNGEKEGAREKIDNFTKHLIDTDRSLAKNPERAREIARGAALRAEGEHAPREGHNGRKR